MGHCQASHFPSLLNFDETGKILETKDMSCLTEL